MLAVSSDLAANARRAGARDVRVVPAMAPPRPPATRSRAEVREELGLDEGRPLVLAVGRLHPQKGYDVLLDAVSRWEADGRLDPAPLVAIAGDGPLEAELTERIRAARLPVLLLGRREDVADLLGAADLCRAAVPVGGQPVHRPGGAAGRRAPGLHPRRRPPRAAGQSAPRWCRWGTPVRSPTPSCGS